MKKLFNKKMMKLYVALLCVMFVFGTVSTGFCIHYTSQYNKITESASSSGGAGNVLSTLLSALAGGEGVSQQATSAVASAITSALTGEDTSSKSNEVSNEEIQALKSKKTVFTVLMIVLLVLGVVFSAGAITSYRYELYLESDKYKAKLKRLKKAEKIKKA